MARANLKDETEQNTEGHEGGLYRGWLEVECHYRLAMWEEVVRSLCEERGRNAVLLFSVSPTHTVIT